jgi:hypothetical protein
MQCNETNIKRSNFDDHIAYRCPKRIIIDQEENEESLEEYLNNGYLLRTINESNRNRRNYEEPDFGPLPTWIIIVKGIHIFVYLSVFIPIAAVLYVTDAIMCPILHATSWLIRFIKLQL